MCTWANCVCKAGDFPTFISWSAFRFFTIYIRYDKRRQPYRTTERNIVKRFFFSFLKIECCSLMFIFIQNGKNACPSQQITLSGWSHSWDSHSLIVVIKKWNINRDPRPDYYEWCHTPPRSPIRYRLNVYLLNSTQLSIVNIIVRWKMLRSTSHVCTNYYSKNGRKWMWGIHHHHPKKCRLFIATMVLYVYESSLYLWWSVAFTLEQPSGVRILHITYKLYLPSNIIVHADCVIFSYHLCRMKNFWHKAHAPYNIFPLYYPWIPLHAVLPGKCSVVS